VPSDAALETTKTEVVKRGVVEERDGRGRDGADGRD